ASALSTRASPPCPHRRSRGPLDVIMASARQAGDGGGLRPACYAPGGGTESLTLNAMAETSYAPCGDLSLAYQVFGDGPVGLVVVGWLAGHLELTLTVPEIKAFFDQLATFCRVLLFDRAGVGLSDPIPHLRTLDDRVAEIEAVMDAAGFERAALFGLGEGG